MSDFICINCAELFDSPVSWVEHHGPTMNETLRGSPCCKEDYREISIESLTDGIITLEQERKRITQWKIQPLNNRIEELRIWLNELVEDERESGG